MSKVPERIKFDVPWEYSDLNERYMNKTSKIRGLYSPLEDGWAYCCPECTHETYYATSEDGCEECNFFEQYCDPDDWYEEEMKKPVGDRWVLDQ